MLSRLEALSLSVKGAILITLAGASLLAASAIAVVSLNRVSDEMTRISTDTLPELTRLISAEATLNNAHLETLRYMTWSFMGVPSETMRRQAGVVADRRAAVEGLLPETTEGEAQSGSILSPELVDMTTRYLASSGEALDMVAIDPSIGGMMVNESDLIFSELIDTFEKDMNAGTAKAGAYVAKQAEASQSAVEVFIAIAAASLLVVLVSTALVVRSVNRPMARMVSAMRDLADDKIDVAIPSEDQKNEIGEMARAVAVFRDNARARRALEEEEAEHRRQEDARAEKSAALQASLASALEQAGRGDFSARLRDDNGVRELDDLAGSMNGLLSNIEKTFSELATELRRMADAGEETDGDEPPIAAVKRALATLEEGLADRARLAEREKAEAAARAERADSLLKFQESLNGVVASASAGDFSVRLDLASDDEDLREIASRTNVLLSGVETAASAASGVLRSFAAGDLDARMEGDFEGVFADLQRDAEATGVKLRELVSEIGEEAAKLNTAAQSIVSEAEDLSGRAAAQAASLQETTANMEVLTETVRRNAKHAAEANAMSEEASRKSAEGAKTVGEARRAMDEVDESARKIAEITSL
ncbi:MAG: methyl-accepting chemotaxis protein, partial [Pseudomonadota bacterium]